MIRPLDIFDLGKNPLTNRRLEGCIHDEVDFVVQSVCKVVAQVDEVEKVDLAAEGDEDIDVAFRPLLSPSMRTE